jgi:hypothetical protein
LTDPEQAVEFAAAVGAEVARFHAQSIRVSPNPSSPNTTQLDSEDVIALADAFPSLSTEGIATLGLYMSAIALVNDLGTVHRDAVMATNAGDLDADNVLRGMDGSICIIDLSLETRRRPVALEVKTLAESIRNSHVADGVKTPDLHLVVFSGYLQGLEQHTNLDPTKIGAVGVSLAASVTARLNPSITGLPITDQTLSEVLRAVAWARPYVDLAQNIGRTFGGDQDQPL